MEERQTLNLLGPSSNLGGVANLNMNKYYAGIGSRETPRHVLSIMEGIAKRLRGEYTLRSGGAIGADSAFEKGAGENKEIFYPKDATSESIALAKTFHPAWENCNEYVRYLMGRNMQILFGKHLDRPVDFIVCWTENGEEAGGTGQALRAAKAHNIKVFNLWHSDTKLFGWDQPELSALLNTQKGA